MNKKIKTVKSLEPWLEKKFKEYKVSVKISESIYRFLHRLRGHVPNLYYHSLGVGYKSVSIGEFEEFKDNKPLLYGGLLHDTGKLRIEAALFQDDRQITNKEYQIIKQHVDYSREMLRDEGLIITSLIAGMHHYFQENPYGLNPADMKVPSPGIRKEKLIDYARIISLSDHHDALMHRKGKFNIDIKDKEAVKRHLLGNYPDSGRRIDFLLSLEI